MEAPFFFTAPCVDQIDTHGCLHPAQAWLACTGFTSQHVCARQHPCITRASGDSDPGVKVARACFVVRCACVPTHAHEPACRHTYMWLPILHAHVRLACTRFREAAPAFGRHNQAWRERPWDESTASLRSRSRRRTEPCKRGQRCSGRGRWWPAWGHPIARRIFRRIFLCEARVCASLCMQTHTHAHAHAHAHARMSANTHAEHSPHACAPKSYMHTHGDACMHCPRK
jgi:hypothetical protein